MSKRRLPKVPLTVSRRIYSVCGRNLTILRTPYFLRGTEYWPRSPKAVTFVVRSQAPHLGCLPSGNPFLEDVCWQNSMPVSEEMPRPEVSCGDLFSVSSLFVCMKYV